MKISSNFDAGNIEVVDETDPGAVRLKIRRDNAADFFQWFYFRASGVRGADCRFEIMNASEAAYPKGWEDYRICASYNRVDWFRMPTSYDGKALSFAHRPERDSVYFAYFAPYSQERHRDLVARCQASGTARLEVLGETLDGDELDMLSVGESGDGKRVCWVIGRQHPGETMAEWWMEGFLDRLLDPADAVARAVIGRAVLHIVPNMNPDGSRRGNLRTNASGANLNREWQDPTMERSPEVFLVRRRMVETGVDFALDVHGDEALPYNFIAGAAHVPAAGDRERALLAAYQTALVQANPDFQTAHGYPPAKQANLSLCALNVAETFGCLAMTLEMPFKDNADAPDDRAGWSPERCRKLGAGCLVALHAVLDELR